MLGLSKNVAPAPWALPPTACTYVGRGGEGAHVTNDSTGDGNRRDRFAYQPREVESLREAISGERFELYLIGTGDVVRALRFYVWNAAVSAAFLWPLHMVEITLRNTVNNRMMQKYGAAWLLDSELVGTWAARTAAKARSQIGKRGAEPADGRIIAELSFAFWVGLFAKARDEALWRRNLCRIFYPTPKRSEVHAHLERLRKLRNRIAHHEPIRNRRLKADYEIALQLLDWLSPDTADWVRCHSRVPELLVTDPAELRWL